MSAFAFVPSSKLEWTPLKKKCALIALFVQVSDCTVLRCLHLHMHQFGKLCRFRTEGDRGIHDEYALC